MIQLEIIPDGAIELPVEAADDSAVGTHLENAGPPDSSPAPAWRDIKRVRAGDGRKLYLQVDGTLDDYNTNALDAFANAIVNNISGVKKHPDGWQEVDG